MIQRLEEEDRQKFSGDGRKRGMVGMIAKGVQLSEDQCVATVRLAACH